LADRRHVHHLLMGLGLNPRRAVLILYCFSAFLCGVVMLGVARQNEYLTLILGIFGCLAFLLVVTSRRDELSSLRDDLQDRLARGRQERTAAKLTWEAIQRIELSPTADAACRILDHVATDMGCRRIRIACDGMAGIDSSWDAGDVPMSGPSAIFRLSGGHGRWITMGLSMGADAPLSADIVFRYMQRLGLALAGRIERLEEAMGAERPAGSGGGGDPAVAATPTAPSPGPARRGSGVATFLWRLGVGAPPASPAGVAASPGPRPATTGPPRSNTPARP
jgi:UDP-GlcNAc:undecaprenyl-phosphate GlcNAc-1-phosphate transferase